MSTPLEASVHAPQSRVGRFIGWLFSWRTLRRALLTLAGLVTLAALFVTEENWRGKHNWERFKRQWEAKGERFDLASFVAKPVPDEQNVLMTPLFAPLFRPSSDRTAPGRQDRAKEAEAAKRECQAKLDVYGDHSGVPPMWGHEVGQPIDLRQWQQFYRKQAAFPSRPQPQDAAGDVLFALGKFEPILSELRQASRRPCVVFPAPTDENIEGLVAYGNTVKAVALVLRLRSAACLEAGRTEDALEDVKLSFRLADTLRAEPLLFAHLMRIAILAITANSVWEYIVRHQWTEPQLAELQSLVSSINLLAEYGHVMRGERAFDNDFYEGLRRGQFGWFDAEVNDHALKRFVRLAGWVPGILYQNQLCVNRLFQERVLDLVDPVQHRVFVDRCQALENLPELKPATPYNVFARQLSPALGNPRTRAGKCARLQTVLDQAAIACALERFRLANGDYPDQLAALAPRFMAKIPPDVINGQPLGYRHTSSGQHVIYSVGWDQKDDGGVRRPLKPKGAAQDSEAGDWIWLVQ
jgi:hypothetical protein